MMVQLQQIDEDQPFNIINVLKNDGQLLFNELQKMAKAFSDNYVDQPVNITSPPICQSGDRAAYIYRLQFFEWAQMQINCVGQALNMADLRQDDDYYSPVPLLSLWSPTTLMIYDSRLTDNINKMQVQLDLLLHLFDIYEFDL